MRNRPGPRLGRADLRMRMIRRGFVPRGSSHTTAPLALRATANVKVVQPLLGHTPAAVTLDAKAIEATAVSLRYSEPPSTGDTGENRT